MTRTTGYAASCATLALVGVAASWPLLDGSGRAGVLTAAALALPLQVGAFWALSRGWDDKRRFFAAWAGGMLLRMGVVAGAAGLVVVSGLPPMATLLGLASFFFGMLLLEPLFLGSARSSPAPRP